MARRIAVGLDIGTSAVRAAQLALGRGAPTLERFGQVELPPGAVRDGEVVDAGLVAESIKTLWKSAKMASRDVIVGVANQRVIVRQVDLPWLPLPELRKSLAFQVQDFIPIPVEQAVLDVHPVQEHTADNGGRMQRVLLVAASRDMVMNSVVAVTKAGLKCRQVDLTPFALLRAVGRTDESVFGAGDAEAIVDVGARVTNIIVHESGVPRFVRILLMGGDDITSALADRLGVPMDQAAALKQDLGLPTATSFGEVEHPGSRAIDAAASAWTEEIRSSLDYYLAQPGAVTVRRLVLSGGGSLLSGLSTRLAGVVRLPVEPASAVTALSVPDRNLDPETAASVRPLLSVPVGLALGAAA